jgi:hypothetical protein
VSFCFFFSSIPFRMMTSSAWLPMQNIATYSYRTRLCFSKMSCSKYLKTLPSYYVCMKNANVHKQMSAKILACYILADFFFLARKISFFKTKLDIRVLFHNYAAIHKTRKLTEIIKGNDFFINTRHLSF